jgi:dienelactone hydrolase
MRPNALLRRVVSIFVGSILLVASSGLAFAQLRLEIIPIESVTLTGEQFLAGDAPGKPVTLAGELRLPRPGTDKLPAVILVHGSGGIGVNIDEWARELNGWGVAAFILDSFSARGITSTVADQSLLAHLAMMVDAYRALGKLAQHPRIDPSRIGVMGFSKGAVAAVFSSSERFYHLYGPSNAKFAAHIGLYTPCNTRYREDDKATGRPIRLFHGIADDYVSIEPCRTYVGQLKKAGVDVSLAEFAGATHAYDSTAYKERIVLPQAMSSRNCSLVEGERGQIMNAKTGKAFDYNDPCMEKGASVGYNAAATQGTRDGVKAFLSITFGLKP